MESMLQKHNKDFLVTEISTIKQVKNIPSFERTPTKAKTCDQLIILLHGWNSLRALSLKKLQ